MKNGSYFQLQVNPDGSFVEKNYYCTIYGKWHLGEDHMDCLFRIVGEKRLILRIDSIESNIQLHYDGDEEYLSFRESVYYYYSSDTAFVTICDRMGERIAINRISFYDGQHISISELDGNSVSLNAFKIPAGTARFSWFHGREAITSGTCNNYNSDSGSVCFVVLPHYNDNMRIVYLGNNEIVYIPYYGYKTCQPSPRTLRRTSKLRLVRTDSVFTGNAPQKAN